MLHFQWNSRLGTPPILPSSLNGQTSYTPPISLSDVSPKPRHLVPRRYRYGHQQIDPIAPELVAAVIQASITSPDIQLPSLLQRQMKRGNDVVGDDSGEGGSGALRTFQKKLDRRAGQVKLASGSSNLSERNTNGAKKPLVRDKPGLSNSKEASDPTALQSKPSNYQATAKGKYSPIERIALQNDNTKQKTCADEESNSSPDKSSIAACDDDSFNPDISSISVAAPIAKRLLTYSQNYDPSPTRYAYPIPSLSSYAEKTSISCVSICRYFALSARVNRLSSI
ncbi:hypothetical protein BDN71DRAFT_1469964, partial [Pleurotus eryngii]